MKRTKILITLGDPAGIGPEIILKAMTGTYISSRIIPICVGSQVVLRDRAELLERQGIRTPPIHEIKSLNEVLSYSSNTIYIIDIACKNQIAYSLGKPDSTSGELAVDSILMALNILQQYPDLSLVTAPISKQAIQMGRYSRFKGHKEILEESLGGLSTVNMIINNPFTKNPLRLVHVTSHIPLREVSDFLLSPVAKTKIAQTVELTNTGLMSMGFNHPQIAITGINPHLEEWGDISRGDLGKEEKLTITPAVAYLQSRGFAVYGPMTADTAYRQAREGKFDVVVSMFHDQSHIAANSDTAGFSNNIILTLGLPFLRLSTSHGLALDIASKLEADETQIRNCLRYIRKQVVLR